MFSTLTDHMAMCTCLSTSMVARCRFLSRWAVGCSLVERCPGYVSLLALVGKTCFSSGGRVVHFYSMYLVVSVSKMSGGSFSGWALPWTRVGLPNESGKRGSSYSVRKARLLSEMSWTSLFLHFCWFMYGMPLLWLHVNMIYKHRH